MKHPLVLLSGLAIAAWLYARRRRLEPTALAGGALAVVGCVLVGIGVIPLPNVEAIVEEVGSRLGQWTYLFVAVFAFLETGAFVGLVAPGETVVIVGGVVAGQGRIDLLTLIAITWAAAVAGDTTSMYLGRRLGRGFLERHGPRVGITEGRLRTVERYFDRHGGSTILIGRFLGLVRALAPFLAGVSRMPLRRFLPYDLIGAGLWATTFCVLGYVFWASIDQVTRYAGAGALALGTIVAIVVAALFVRRLLNDPAYRGRVRIWIERRPGGEALLRVAAPVWHRLGGPLRWVYGRLTPGELGLELTTLLALAGVGAFAFAFFGEAPTEAIDRRAFEISDAIGTRLLDDLARAITDVGSLPAVGLATLLTAAWAAGRGRAVDAGMLVAGLALTWVFVGIAKDGYGRVRPDGALIETAGLSYPSGHAAYAVGLVACAVVLVRAGVPWALRIGAVTVAVLLAVAIALSRVQLRAHFLSDVIGGAGLAVALMSCAGIVAVVAAHNRATPRARGDAAG